LKLPKWAPWAYLGAFFLCGAALLFFAAGMPFIAALVSSLLLTAALWGAAWLLCPLGRGYPRLFGVCAALGAVLLLGRIPFFPVATSDYLDFLAPWTERLRSLGGFAGLGQEVGNYNVPYMVLLALFSYVDAPPLPFIKLVSTLTDLLLALTCARLVYRLGGRGERALISFVLTLLLPTVFINSALWGQCDSVYVSLALLGLLLCLEDRPGRGMAVFGLSFAIKLQAIFILPTVAVLLLMKKVKWYHLPLFPAAYLLAVSPAILAGRSIGDTLLFYLNTAESAGSSLNYNSPSLFSLYRFYWMDEAAQAAAGRAGILAAGAAVLAVLILCLVRRKHLDERGCFYASLFFCLAIPLLLPHMHDRYFYYVDAMTLVLACLLPWLTPAVLLSQFASLLGYHAYFFMRYLLPMKLGFYGLAAVCVCVLLLFLTSLAGFCPPRQKRPSEPLSCRRRTASGGGDE